MNKGPILIIILVAIVAGVVVFLRPILFDKELRSTSNASTATEAIRIGGDDYAGYWFLNCPDMKKMAPRKGFTIDFTNDGGDYFQRLNKFAGKKYDAIVLPINSYLQHGAKFKFPGVIVAAISESRGADAIVGFKDVLPNNKINDLNNPDLHIIYTGGSPSSFLLDLVIADFGMDALQEDNSWRAEVSSSKEAFKMAKKALKNRSVGDAFVLWEPHVSKAVNDLGLVQLWGSDQFSGYIIDVLVVHRSFLKKKADLVNNFLKTYFRILDTYAADKDRMIGDMSRSMRLKKGIVESMVKKIDWFDFNENCLQLFGIQTSVGVTAYDRIYSSIIQCANVLETAGSFDNSQLQDPYLIVNSLFLEDLAKSNISKVGKTATRITFDPLSDAEWKRAKEIGVMRIKPISFQSGTDVLNTEGKEVVDKVAGLLTNNYPTYRVAVRGHTGPGDEKENMKLSVARAKMVTQRLIAVHNVDPNRLHAEGYGAIRPPKRKPGESTRAIRFRMPRVEFVLLEGNKL